MFNYGTMPLQSATTNEHEVEVLQMALRLEYMKQFDSNEHQLGGQFFACPDLQLLLTTPAPVRTRTNMLCETRPTRPA